MNFLQLFTLMWFTKLIARMRCITCRSD